MYNSTNVSKFREPTLSDQAPPPSPPQDLASSLKISFLETSAKNSENVEKLFLTMASDIHQRLSAEGGGMHEAPRGAKTRTASIDSAPVWLGGEKQAQNSGSCC